MQRVILESPFAAETPNGKKANILYARACLRDCLTQGESPIASHLLYTQSGVLDDDIPGERTLGIEAGLAWGVEAHKTVVYTDRGISKGMKYGIERANREGRVVEFRILPKSALAEVNSQIETLTADITIDFISIKGV